MTNDSQMKARILAPEGPEKVDSRRVKRKAKSESDNGGRWKTYSPFL